MAVNNVTTNAQMAYSSVASAVRKTAQAPAKKQDEAVAEQAGKGIGEAYSVNLSAAGQQAAKQAESAKDTKAGAVDAEGTEKTKGLTADQVRQLQEQTDQSYSIMIQAMTEQNMKVQNLFNEGIYSLDFDGTKVGIEQFMLPPVGTTPEEAQAAISEGGAYSVGAVSDRIFGLAEALAGGDSGKLSEMRAAVEEGFRQAGLVFKDITGKDDMPQITHDTYDEIMSRFDKKAEEMGGIA
ncbi:MAG: hypothetical protein IJ741_00990 [Schwartzia sp.]|nr:hypothetical protein [Schwartzia sp. (in: firmicutes)]